MGWDGRLVVEELHKHGHDPRYTGGEFRPLT